MAKITQKLQFFLKTGFALIFPFGLSPKKIVFCRKVGHELNIRLCWSISALFNFEAIENKFSKSVDIEKQQTEKNIYGITMSAKVNGSQTEKLQNNIFC